MTLSVRARAARVVGEVLENGKTLSQLLPAAGRGLEPRDQALLQELCFGACRFAHRYTVLTDSLLRKPFKKRDLDIQALLLVGIYQLLESRIPDHAALADTVEAAVELKKPWAKGLVNAVLRGVQRDRESLERKWQTHPQFRWSHPQWLIDELQTAWPSHWAAICDANNARPPMTLRLHVHQQSREAYLAHLRDQNLDAQATPFSKCGLTLDQPAPVEQLPGFREGRVAVQDEAAQLAASLLRLKAGQRVLDACCAPGGKTCHLLETEPDLQVVALDNDAVRLVRVRENLERHRLQAVLIEGDAGQPDRWWDGKLFDRILLDAPCSATGVIRRHPDIKCLRTPADVGSLKEQQACLLNALWPLLKEGGRLVYATCSVLPRENSDQLETFLAQRQDAAEVRIDADWGVACAVGRQLFPQSGGHDGFYYAVIEKVRPRHSATPDA